MSHRLVPLGQRKIAESTLANQIIDDDRFVPIGRSGQWGLKAWSDINTKSILTLMEECLITHNKPVTTDEIFTHVSNRRPVSRASILWYLSSEKEIFVKSSLTSWGLAKWSDVAEENTWNTEQVADFVANIFNTNKATELSYKSLKEAFMKESGISATQADTSLRQNPVIRTRSKTAWGEITAVFQPNYKAILTRANLNASHQRRNLHKEVEESTYNILSAAPDKQMPMTELIQQLKTYLDCAPKTAYNVLTTLDFVERINIPGSTKKICRLKQRIANNSTHNGTLHQRISASVRGILEATSNKQMFLAELIADLQKEYNCSKTTLYRYIANLDYIDRLEISNSNAKYIRIKISQRSDLFPQVQHIADSTLKEKIERVLPFLTVENVDIGLFLLSKEFKSTLKTYLLKAIANGKLTILPPGKTPDKWNLIGMVECARENGIISDHATFHYLRQARNDRAHGTMPSLAERQILMKSIQHIAGLYIDYIKLLDDLTQNL